MTVLIRKSCLGIATAALLALVLTTVSAQSPALDPVRVAPHIFETVLDNERVRVLKVTDRNGQTEPLHAHPDRVVVFLSPCAWMETSENGQESMQSFRLGDVIWADRITHGGETSRVVQECSLLEIELK
jgi:hypothetical protein